MIGGTDDNISALVIGGRSLNQSIDQPRPSQIHQEIERDKESPLPMIAQNDPPSKSATANSSVYPVVRKPLAIALMHNSRSTRSRSAD